MSRRIDSESGVADADGDGDGDGEV